jgi:hypothetical protein
VIGTASAMPWPNWEGDMQCRPGLHHCSKVEEVHCEECGKLLSKVSRQGIHIVRSGLRAMVEGGHRATLCCYNCQLTNIRDLRTDM